MKQTITRRKPKTSAQKALEKLAKLNSQGRYIDGEYFSKGGTAVILGYWEKGKFVEPAGGHQVYFASKPVDKARLEKYVGLWDSMIRSYFPALGVWGAGWDYDDLIASCRVETFKALTETFDPDNIRSGVAKLRSAAARAKRYVEEKELCRDTELLYSVAERGWVKERLHNFLRRTQWAYHPQQLGGCTQSITAFSDEANQNREIEQNLFYETTVYSPEAQQETERLLDAMDELGAVDAAKLFFSIGRAMREEIIDVLESRRDTTKDLAVADDTLFELLSTREGRRLDFESREV